MPPARKRQRTDANASSSGSKAAATAGATQPTTRRMTRAAAREEAKKLDAIETTDEVNEPKRQGSSARATNAKVKRGIRIKGRLQSLPDLAIELQLMIYNELESRDLHHLSRTCKKFRAFFLNKDLTERLWEQARKNAGDLPERPPFMSEPAFIHLLYTPNCHECGAQNVRTIIHEYFTRLCSTCYQERLVDAFMFQIAVGLCSNGSQLALFNACSTTATTQAYCLSLTAAPGSTFNYLLTKGVEDIVERIKSLPESMTSGDAKAFVEGIIQEQEFRSQFANGIRTWLDNQENMRQQQLKDAQERRFEAILARLRDAGWGPELDFLGDYGIYKMSIMPIVRQSAKLTQGSWLKVKAALDKDLNTARSERLGTELRATLRARFKLLEEALLAHYVKLPRNALMDCRPKSIDLAFTPECRALVDVPSSETVTVDDFAAIVPAISERWEANIKEQLTMHIRPHIGEVAPDIDPLSLAIAVFWCDYDASPLRWPDILAHSCANRPCVRTAYAQRKDFECDDAYTYATKAQDLYPRTITRDSEDRREKYHVPFRLSTLGPESDGEPVKRMHVIVSAAGLDPAKATIEDLERCDVWLRCSTCEQHFPLHNHKVMSWRAAFVHYHEYAISPTGVHRWYRADDDDMSRVRAFQESAPSKFASLSSSLVFSCALCSAFDSIPRDMPSHIREVHNIEDVGQALRDGTVYCHPSVSGRFHMQSIDVERRGAEEAKTQ
ncbi:hypothetical protein C2E23DRAFT_718879 [Lenzites betulinus]|nr:hypothetical protein C2E23DRAFT_718879 [Lenzites betulinus]